MKVCYIGRKKKLALHQIPTVCVLVLVIKTIGQFGSLFFSFCWVGLREGVYDLWKLFLLLRMIPLMDSYIYFTSLVLSVGLSLMYVPRHIV